jgi:hypothetical protein
MAVRSDLNRFAVLAALAAVAILWFLVARTMANPPAPAASSVRPTGLVWGGRVFTAKKPFWHWLHVRGVAYSVWSGRHPQASKIF